MGSKKLVAFSGSRAEFGLQAPILKECMRRGRFDVRVILGGSHLDDGFGATAWEAAELGVPIYAHLPMLHVDGSPFAAVHAIAQTTIAFQKVLQDLAPDLCMVYADRHETFGAAVAATQMGIPTVHIEGGDITNGGTLDDGLRDAISRLAHFHLTTSNLARDRLIRLGEEPSRVVNIGTIASDIALSGAHDSPEQVLGQLNLAVDKPIILATLHPIPLDPLHTTACVDAFERALTELMSDEFQILLTYPNNDPGHLEIISMIKRLQQGSAMANLHVVQSLGSRRFHAVLAASRMTQVFVLGNSSAGLKEAGAFGCFTINIGNRQRGRARGSSVIDVSPVASEVVSAVRRAFQSAQFETFANETPYIGGQVAQRAADALESVPLTTDILIKRAWCVSADSHKWE